MQPNVASFAEPHHRDFVARFPRDARGFGARRGLFQQVRHHGRRLAALAVAIAVPAFAAPAQWHGFPPFEEARAEAAMPMGFETRGESFPGSAFYYLADEPYMPLPAGSQIHSDAEPAPAVDELGGASARPFVLGGSTTDRARALQCMTMAIYYEAATEADAGQRAVAQVVLNRVAHPAYPNTVCGVVFQGSERSTGCQFSFTCDGSLARAPSRKFWERAQRVAMAALSGAVYAPVGLATHYHTVQIHPYWADSLTHVGTIGAHRFYRWRGEAGLPAAFRFAYSGGEPLPVRHARNTVDEAAGADPIELARAYEASLAAARQAGDAQLHDASYAPSAPKPAYSAEVQARGGEALYSGALLPASGGIKPEYAQSGQWIAQP